MAQWKKVVVSGSSLAQLDNSTTAFLTSNGDGVVSGSSQITYTDLSAIPGGIVSGSEQLPAGLVSGSSQITVDGLLPAGTVSGSSQVVYTDLSSIPAGIISGSEQLPAGLVSGSSQVDLAYTDLSSIPAGIISGSEQLPAGLVSGSSQVDLAYTDLSSIPAGIISGSEQLPGGIVSGSSQVVYTDLSSIPGGIVSGSEQLPAGLVSGSSQITVDGLLPAGTVSGSSQVVYTDLSSIPAGIISGSEQLPGGLVSGSGDTRLTQLGLGSTDSVTFNGLDVTGNLVVQGTASFSHSDNLLVKDSIILLGSGSAASSKDGGIVIYQSGDAPEVYAGNFIGYQANAGETDAGGRYGVAAGIEADASAVTLTEFIPTVKVATSSPEGDGDVASDKPAFGGTGGFGSLWINSNTNEAYIYV